VSEPQSGAAPLPARIKATFLTPSSLPDLLRSAPWLDVLLISTGIALLAVLGAPDEVFLEPMRDAVSRRGEPVVITSPPEDIVRWGRAMTMLGTLATHPMIAIFLAGFLTLVLSSAGGGAGSYRDYLSLASHGLLIPALGTLLALAIRISTGISSGWGAPAPLPDSGTGSLFETAALAVDPFVLWMLVVLALGAARFDGKRPTWRIGLLLVGAYILLVLGTSALTVRSAT
jgi:hypothetical protein